MKITNKFDLHPAFYRAVVNDPYDNGGADYSASGFGEAPRAHALIKQNWESLEVDCSSRTAATIGQGAHAILERAARPNIDIVEKRYFAELEVDGQVFKISAQIDLLETDTGALSDWKTTKAYAFHKKAGAGKKPEWIQQLNVQRWVLAKNNVEVKSLSIVGLLKDWDIKKRTEPGYPFCDVVTAEMPMWSLEETENFMREKIRKFESAKKELPLCSSGDAWGGNRCAQWCDANSVCSQYQDSLKTGILFEKKGVAV